MLIGVLTFGAAATAIVIAALVAHRSGQVEQPKQIVRPVPGPDEPRDDENAEGNDDREGAGDKGLNDQLKRWKAKLGDLTSKIVIDDPEPEQPDLPPGPDPYSPSPHPVQGDYYQVTKGDRLWDIAAAAYGKGSRYTEIVAAPENQWMRKPPATTWKGGLYARYNGWNTVWNSGTKYGVLYIP